jgi:hopanoid biosynthesis associated RND transporter like protein HpnN
MLAPVDAFINRRRRAVLALAFAAALASCALLPELRFDSNPLSLKSRTVESMTTLEALTSDPDWTPNAINVLAPSLEAAQRLVPRLAALPEVSRAVTLASFIPAQQPEKLALIGDAAKRLASILAARTRAPPSDAEVQQSLAATERALRQAADEAGVTAACSPCGRLADALQRLRGASFDARAAAAAAVVTPLNVLLDQIRAMLQARPITRESLPRPLIADWTAKDGRARIQVLPRTGQDGSASLRRFAQAVQSVASGATGAPISTRASGDSVVHAFLEAGAYSLVSIAAMLVLVLRRARDVVLTLLPVLLSGLLTFATCAALDLPLNFANIIALPLLFGVGVAFNIYFVLAWRAGETSLLQSSLMRAVVFSAMTTATAFGTLWLSSHPGTASMGRLLMISLGWELLVTLLFRPALLARPPVETRHRAGKPIHLP